jgi:hypothetical protein
LFCKTLKTRLAGEDIFGLVDCHLTLHHHADIRDICTDGAKSVLGKQRGFIASVKSIVYSRSSFPIYVPDGHLHRETYTRCCIDTIGSTDDEHRFARNI